MRESVFVCMHVHSPNQSGASFNPLPVTGISHQPYRSFSHFVLLPHCLSPGNYCPSSCHTPPPPPVIIALLDCRLLCHIILYLGPETCSCSSSTRILCFSGSFCQSARSILEQLSTRSRILPPQMLPARCNIMILCQEVPQQEPSNRSNPQSNDYGLKVSVQKAGNDKHPESYHIFSNHP